jgi:hypothetical protein
MLPPSVEVVDHHLDHAVFGAFVFIMSRQDESTCAHPKDGNIAVEQFLETERFVESRASSTWTKDRASAAHGPRVETCVIGRCSAIRWHVSGAGSASRLPKNSTGVRRPCPPQLIETRGLVPDLHVIAAPLSAGVERGFLKIN